MRMGLAGNAAAGSCAWIGAARSSAAAARTALISVELRARGLDDAAPAREVALDLGGELLRRIGNRLDAVAVQPLEEIRAADDGDRVVVDLLHDVARRSRGRHEAVPGGDVEAGERFGDRPPVRQGLGTSRSGDAQRLGLAAAGELDRGGC